MRGPSVLLLLGLLGLLAACAGAPPSPREIVIDRDDIEITGDVVVRPGHYRVRDVAGDGVLRILGDGITVTMTGVTLDGAADGATPDTFEGIGVAVAGGSRVRIVGGALRGFRIGLRATGARGLELDGLDVSHNRAARLGSTPLREDPADWLWPHDNDRGEWEARYGAGIALVDCARALVQRCRARGTQNGLLLTRCRDAAVHGNDFSFLSGWGIALYRSTHCRIEQNRCDFCVRGYSDGVYARGQDSAGILMFEQCCHNRIAGNSATHSGDGLFLYAGHETTQRTGAGGSNDNEVLGNDFSFAVANGIEATFSRGNVFAGNRLDGCDHGVWAGYSYDTEIRGNSMRGCRNGVSIEHGHDNRIVANTIADCGLGVHLWWDDDAELLASAYGVRNETASARNTIRGNWITSGRTALRVDGDTGSRVVGNHVAGAAVALDARGATAFGAFSDNAVEAALSVRCATAEPLELGANHWTPFVAGGPQRVAAGERLAARPQVPRPPADEATAVADFPGDLPRGRAHIVVGEWGPLDPREPALVSSSAGGAAALRVLGSGLPFRVSMSDGFAAEPAVGTAPALVHVRRRDGAGAPVATWQADVRIGDAAFAAHGTLVEATWRVRWWSWRSDPRDDAAAWTALLATPPLAETALSALDFDWGGRAPHANVPADRFATLAEATVDLPAGRYRLATVSDDGIRVSVDGAVVLEDWTWHAPRERGIELDLAGGRHTVTVEHFELDGHAALRCWFEPAAR